MPATSARRHSGCLPQAELRGCGSLLRLRPDRRDREIKDRALMNRRLRPDSSAVSINDAVHRREPYSSSWKIRFTVQTLKRAKETLGITHVKACSVVANKE